MSHHCTCTTDDVISDQICIIGKLECLWNKKDIAKTKTPFYSTLESILNECIFKMTYFSGHMHFKVVHASKYGDVQEKFHFVKIQDLRPLNTC